MHENLGILKYYLGVHVDITSNITQKGGQSGVRKVPKLLRIITYYLNGIPLGNFDKNKLLRAMYPYLFVINGYFD